MNFVQIYQSFYETPISGADLRNHAIAQCLRKSGSVRQIAIEALNHPSTDSDVNPFIADFGPDTPDLIVFESVWLFEYAQMARQAFPTARIVFDFHNVESALLKEMDRARLPSALRALALALFGQRWRAAKRLEKRAIAMADAVWFCSDDDAALAEKTLKTTPASFANIPNVRPLWCEEIPPIRPEAAPVQPVILYLGHLGYAPNKSAVRRLVRKIMPAIQKQFPKAHLIVAGRSPNARLRRFLARYRHVELVANPAEIAPLYARADICVLPITEGGGSRIKVLEALSVGCPIVATAKAVEGLNLEAGRHFLLAQTPRQTQEAVARLINDPHLSAALKDEGRRFVQASHSAQAMLQALEKAIAALFAHGN
jgi:glycosyltransferase involved in cell wall biosynthesis